MDFSPSPRAAELLELVTAFVRDEIEPVAADYHRQVSQAARRREPGAESPLLGELRSKARAQGLWNLFLPAEHAERLRQAVRHPRWRRALRTPTTPRWPSRWAGSFLAPYVFNCNAPDTGNMEVLLKYGTDEQKAEWLEPLLDGRIRSAFTMTEPDVASSDATNMEATAVVDGDEVVINGRKWWSTGVGHPDCKVLVFMGALRPRRRPAPPAHDGARPARHPRRQGRAAARRR